MSDAELLTRTVRRLIEPRRTELRIARIKARNINEGDLIVVRVARVLGVQGRKPTSGAPLMKLEYEDGTTETLREDDSVEVLRS